jgi:hypothetical protein
MQGSWQIFCNREKLEANQMSITGKERNRYHIMEYYSAIKQNILLATSITQI